jgi:hypothetical protein
LIYDFAKNKYAYCIGEQNIYIDVEKSKESSSSSRSCDIKSDIVSRKYEQDVQYNSAVSSVVCEIKEWNEGRVL